MSGKPQVVVLASSNAGKLRELQSLLGDAWSLRPQAEFGVTDADETGLTFEANALIKARHAAAATGLPALADDSGLEVDALNGEPGVYSARYAGPQASDAENNARLLAALDGVPVLERTARFRAVLAFVRGADDPEPIVVDGRWEGYIGLAPVGEGGFGYDPLFVDGPAGMSSAQLAPAVKNARSHRGQAAKALRALLDENPQRFLS